jgi:hypothetical protein
MINDYRFMVAVGASLEDSAIQVACPFGDQEAHGVGDVVACPHSA